MPARGRRPPRSSSPRSIASRAPSRSPLAASTRASAVCTSAARNSGGRQPCICARTPRSRRRPSTEPSGPAAASTRASSNAAPTMPGSIAPEARRGGRLADLLRRQLELVPLVVRPPEHEPRADPLMQRLPVATLREVDAFTRELHCLAQPPPRRLEHRELAQRVEHDVVETGLSRERHRFVQACLGSRHGARGDVDGAEIRQHDRPARSLPNSRGERADDRLRLELTSELEDSRRSPPRASRS